MRVILAGLALVLAACAAQEPSGSTGGKPQVGAQADSQLLAPPPVVQTLSDPPAQAPPTSPPVSPGQGVDAAACQASGGSVRPVCRLQRPMCVIAYRDAGKACTDGAQCDGDCMAKEVKAQWPPGEASGVCSASNDPCGCRQKIVNGVAQPALCVD